jgi:hypothetical protein
VIGRADCAWMPRASAFAKAAADKSPGHDAWRNNGAHAPHNHAAPRTPDESPCLAGLGLCILAAGGAAAMKPEKLLERLAAGHLDNVAFADFRRLAEAFGFRLERVRGSHQIFGHPQLPAALALQDRKGQAKPYQIRQLLVLVEDYNLTLEKGSRR